MDILLEYSRALWNVYHKTLRKKQHTKMKKNEEIKLARILFETKKLCALVDKQRECWIQGKEKRWPIDPYTKIQDPETLIYTLDNYPHMAPDIKKFMDRSATEYVKLFGEK